MEPQYERSVDDFCDSNRYFMMVILWVIDDMTLFATFANGIYFIVTVCLFLNVTATTALSPALTSCSARVQKHTSEGGKRLFFLIHAVTK